MEKRREVEERLLRFLQKRGCEGLFDEVVGSTDRIAVGNCFYSYLPAVAYVVLRDGHGVRLSPAEVTCEGLGSTRFRFIQRVRRALGIGRGSGAAGDGAIQETLVSICDTLGLPGSACREAGSLNAVIPPSRRAAVRELFYYCASLVCVAVRRTGCARSRPELARSLDISPNLVRKYERFIKQELARSSL